MTLAHDPTCQRSLCTCHRDIDGPPPQKPASQAKIGQVPPRTSDQIIAPDGGANGRGRSLAIRRIRL